MNSIQMIDENTYFLKARGNEMTLNRENDDSEWAKLRMITSNASVRAYGTLGVKYFSSLKEVEKSYKTWRGIEALIG